MQRTSDPSGFLRTPPPAARPAFLACWRRRPSMRKAPNGRNLGTNFQDAREPRVLLEIILGGGGGNRSFGLGSCVEHRLLLKTATNFSFSAFARTLLPRLSPSTCLYNGAPMVPSQPQQIVPQSTGKRLSKTSSPWVQETLESYSSPPGRNASRVKHRWQSWSASIWNTLWP